MGGAAQGNQSPSPTEEKHKRKRESRVNRLTAALRALDFLSRLCKNNRGDGE